MEEKISPKQLREIHIHYMNLIQEITYNGGDERCEVIGMAASYAVGIALYDETILFETEENDLDEDLDSFTWDTSYLISLIYSSDDRAQKDDIKCAEYWGWYLDELCKMGEI